LLIAAATATTDADIIPTIAIIKSARKT